MPMIDCSRRTAEILGCSHWDEDYIGNMDVMGESEEEDKLPRNAQDSVMQVHGGRLLVHDYLETERDSLIACLYQYVSHGYLIDRWHTAVHELNFAVLEDPPHASGERFAWQRSGVAVAKKS